MSDSDYHHMPDDIDCDDMGADINSLLDEFFAAKMRVVALEQENAELKGKVDNLQRWKEQIEGIMMDDTINKRSDDNIITKEKQPRHKTDEQQCFYNFCNAYKKDAATLARVSAKVTSLGYTGVKKVPWGIVKLELRTMYENLSEADKIKYLDNSRNNQ